MTEAQVSFPVTNKPLTAGQWNSVTLGIGNGSMDQGISNYYLTFDNTTDSVTIAPPSAFPRYAHMIVGGFYHRLYESVVLQLPPVKEKTRYFIVACMDPAKAATNPVELQVLKGALDRTGGKQYVIITTVDREPNKVLTDSVIRRTMPRLAPSIEVENYDALPEPDDFMIGTKGHVVSNSCTYRSAITQSGKREWVQIHGTSTHDLQPMPGWAARSSTGGKMMVTPMSDGWKCEYHGQFIRKAYAFTIGDEWLNVGTFIPEKFRTVDWIDQQIAGTYFDGWKGAIPIYYQVDFQAGILYARMERGRSVDLGLDSALNIDVTWCAKRERTAW